MLSLLCIASTSPTIAQENSPDIAKKVQLSSVVIQTFDKVGQTLM
jgi:hypothetical protein